jgi:hypothetical protein
MEPKITFLNQHATWSREEKTRFRSIVEQLSSVPAIRELIFKSFNGKGTPVYFMEPEGMLSSGCTCNDKIVLRNNLTIVNAATTLIFELCNASRYGEFPKLYTFKSADSLAFEAEAFEFKSVLMFVEVLQSVASARVIEVFADEEVAEIERCIFAYSSTWEQYWESVNVVQDGEPCSHADSYRLHFRNAHSDWSFLLFRFFFELTRFFLKEKNLMKE